MLTMRHFLEIVAQHIFKENYNPKVGLSNCVVVFPNRRAALYFDEYLSQQIDTPFWAAQYLTIDELFYRHSSLRLADSIELVSALYDAYREISGSSEEIDSFWPWGEILLADFDDIDMNYSKSSQIFSLLKEQREISQDLSFLSDSQIALLSRFFERLHSRGETEIKRRILEIWAILGEVYQLFKQRLQAKGIGYKGMIQRQIINLLESNAIQIGSSENRYCFVGFNRLAQTEKALFHHMKSRGIASFYWDYDTAYSSNEYKEVGRYIKENISLFPNAITDTTLFNNLSAKRSIEIISTDTNNEQASYIPTWINSLGNSDRRHCAIVLCNEQLLQPVIHAIPDSVETMNITMGYPLIETPIYNLVSTLIEFRGLLLQSGGKISVTAILNILTNPIVRTLSNEAESLIAEIKRRGYVANLGSLCADNYLTTIFCNAEGGEAITTYLLKVISQTGEYAKSYNEEDIYRPLNQESIYRVYTIVQRLERLLQDGVLRVKPTTLCRLIIGIMNSTSIPFHGEPVLGIQIMGVIETRNLDFENILLLSANDGNLPKNLTEVSFIPFSIRSMLGLTTSSDKSAITAYNFYHLIGRATNITIMYNSSTDSAEKGSGEMSRYLLQLLCRRDDIRLRQLQSDISSISVKHNFIVDKDRNIFDKLFPKEKDYTLYLSPSALAQYISCPLKFFFANILELREIRPVTENIDSALFGTILHKSAELLYEEIASNKTGRVIEREDLENYLHHPELIERHVLEAFRIERFKERENGVTLDLFSGIESINFAVINRYIKGILRLDIKSTPFRYFKGEVKGLTYTITHPHPYIEGEQIKVMLGGIIDRIDFINNSNDIRIIDYKTGSTHKEPKELDDLFGRLFNEKNNKSCGYILQIFYYSLIVSKHPKFRGSAIVPQLVYTRNVASKNDSEDYLTIGGEPIKDFVTQYSDKFEQRLREALFEKIFNKDGKIEPTNNEKECTYCPYKTICNR